MAAPTLHDDIKVVSGGHLRPGNTLQVEVKEVDGLTYFKVDRCCYYMGQFLSRQFAMLDRISELRNQQVDSLLKAGQVSADVLADIEAVDDDALRGSRSELAHSLPSIMQVEVEGQALGIVTLNVLPDWHKRKKVFIEFSAMAFKVLLDKPTTHAKNAEPMETGFQNVNHDPKKNQLVARIKVEGKWKRKTRPIDPTLAESDLIDVIERKSRKLQEWYERGGVSSDDE